MGILPVIGGFASLRLPERRGDPAYRAFAAYAAATILCVSLYTAVKAAYLSTVFATLWEERNLIYLSPLLLVGTALVFESKKLDWRIVGGGGGVRPRDRAVQGRSSSATRTSRRPASGSPRSPTASWHWDVDDLQARARWSRSACRSLLLAAAATAVAWRPRSPCSCSRGC